MAIWFTPPLVEEPRLVDRDTGMYINVSIGISVLKESGAYRQVRDPSQVELEAADLYYLGGHRYEIDADEQAALTAAGYAAYIEESA